MPAALSATGRKLTSRIARLVLRHSAYLKPTQLAQTASSFLRSDGGECNVDLLGSKDRMVRRQADRPRLFLRANPDRPGASNQRKRVIADEHGGAFQLQPDGVVCKRTNGSEFIGHAQHDARSIRSISVQLRLVRKQGKSLINAFAGEGLRDHLLAPQVSFNAQIPPVRNGFLQVRGKRGVA